MRSGRKKVESYIDLKNNISQPASPDVGYIRLYSEAQLSGYGRIAVVDEQGQKSPFDPNLYITKNCESIVSVGDLVYIDTGTNIVKKNIDNRSIASTIGIAIQKPTSTTCVVLLNGIYTIGQSILNPGMKVYISTAGVLSSTLPITGYIQIIGIATDVNQLYVNPSHQRVNLG